MKRITDLKQNGKRAAAVALGCFDGLHLGHRAVIGRAVADKAKGLVPSVFTFAENPLQILTGTPVPALLTPAEKSRLLEEMGIEQVFMPSFRKVMDLEASTFVQTVLKTYCKAETVYCGFNFRFGKGGKADAQDLKRLCAECAIAVEVVQAVSVENSETVSSTQIRRYLQQGQPEKAAQMLGRWFSYRFPVIKGNQLGRTLGVPTINQALPAYLVEPRRGVYASLVTLENGAVYYGVTNIGVKPTVGKDCAVASETWIPDFNGDLYGACPKTELVHYIRQERKFDSLPALGAQIQKDKEQAFQWLTQNIPI